MSSLRLLAIMAFASTGGVICMAEVSDSGSPRSCKEIQQKHEPAEQQTDKIHPANGKATLMFVADGGAIWRVSELIEETRYHRGQKFHHRYYLQQLTEPEAVLVLAEVGSPGEPDAKVTGPGRPGGMVITDGILIISRPGGVRWYRPGGQIAESPRDQWISLQRGIYTDGVLVQRGSEALRFIPFRENQLDMQNEVEVAPADVKSFQYGEPVRHGSVFAWTTREALHFFDLNTAKHWKTSLPFDLGVVHRVTAFDGQTVIVNRGLPFDAEKGTVVGQGEFSDAASVGRHFKSTDVGGFLTLRNRIAYYVHDEWLWAVDLTSVPLRSLRLIKVALQPVGEGTKGLHVWTGQRWSTVLWLESVPPNRGQ